MSMSVAGNKNKLSPSSQISFFETSTPCGANIRAIQQKRINAHGKPITTMHGTVKNPNGSDLDNLDQQLHGITHPKDEFHIFDEGKPQFPNYKKKPKNINMTPAMANASQNNPTMLMALNEEPSKKEIPFPMQENNIF